MKKIMILVIALILMTNVTTVSAANNTSYKEAEAVFSKNETEKALRKARNQVVYSDKGEKSVKVLGKISGKEKGTFPTRPGIILVTSDAYKNLIPTGHAAIVYSKGYVIEALSNGVVKGKNNWRSNKKEFWGVTTSSTSAGQDATIVDMCYNEVKRKTPYNYNYLDIKTRKRFYCSHLIYAKYKDRYGIDLNTSAYTYSAIHPLELVNTSKTCTLYYYKK